ncbi:cell division protein FtsW [Candidatus Dependentiae bacterium]|nr:MAG: cell division protein FtsW [Candidatus Dependentiae bacterium]
MLVKNSTLLGYKKKLLLIILLLVIIGIVFIYSASTVLAIELHNNSQFFIKKHIFGLMLGVIGYCIGRLIPISFVQQYALLWWLCASIVTLATLYSPYAVLIHGSKRWLKIAGLIFQPSELLKMSFIIYIALFFSKQPKTKTVSSYIPLIIICAITSFILLMQPDFGLTITLLITTIFLFFITCSSLKYFLLLVGFFIVGTIGLIISKPYRLQRILTFLDPWKDPKGKGFQIIQSFIAIGSGGWYGTGITHSKQKFFYLPMQHTDFIFSIFAEETGFIGSIVLISLFAMIMYIGLFLSMNMKNRFGAFCVLSFTILIILQSIINIAVATGLVPTKGIGLPFISYGNTHTVCTLAIIGFLINVIQNDSKNHC